MALRLPTINSLWSLAWSLISLQPWLKGWDSLQYRLRRWEVSPTPPLGCKSFKTVRTQDCNHHLSLRAKRRSNFLAQINASREALLFSFSFSDPVQKRDCSLHDFPLTFPFAYVFHALSLLSLLAPNSKSLITITQITQRWLLSRWCCNKSFFFYPYPHVAHLTYLHDNYA